MKIVTFSWLTIIPLTTDVFGICALTYTVFNAAINKALLSLYKPGWAFERVDIEHFFPIFESTKRKKYKMRISTSVDNYLVKIRYF